MHYVAVIEDSPSNKEGIYWDRTWWGIWLVVPFLSDKKRKSSSGGAVSPTITCNPENIYVYESMEKELQNKRYRIRKLTPRECFRLMDVCESDIDKIQASGVSESQQYKMAGNSIVVACMEGIFKNLFSAEEQELEGQLSLF